MSSVFPDPRRWLDLVPKTFKTSVLYTTWWQQLKDDPEVFALLALVDSDQPIPVTFFTTVNYLVLGEPLSSLAWYYPLLHPERREAAFPCPQAYPVFRAFVLAHQEELRALLPTARLQTNEIARCANLLPAFVLAYERGGYQPLHMVEIGCSSGLNLFWNQYLYRYGDVLVGNPLSPIVIPCAVDGVPLPLGSQTRLPRVATCQGIELLPRDLSSEEDLRWLRAAIWPEERERYHRLDAASALAQQHPPLPILVGDACEYLPKLLAAIPEQETGVVWHSYALHQGPSRVKKLIDQQIAEASHRIPLYRISLEFALNGTEPRLLLYEYQGGNIVRLAHLANCAIHGERMTWLFDDTLPD